MIHLRRIHQVSADEFGLTAEKYAELLQAQENRMEVVSLKLVTDEYYDIELGDGSKYYAISSYHLMMVEP